MAAVSRLYQRQRQRRGLFYLLWLITGGCVAGATAEPNCVSLEGNAIQGGVLWGKTTPDASVTFAELAVPVLPDGSFLLGLGRDMPASNTLKVKDDETCVQQVAVASREYRLQTVNGVPQQTVTPSEEHLERIRAERVKVRNAKAQRLARDDGLRAVRDGFVWPVTGRISGVYGS